MSRKAGGISLHLQKLSCSRARHSYVLEFSGFPLQVVDHLHNLIHSVLNICPMVDLCRTVELPHGDAHKSFGIYGQGTRLIYGGAKLEVIQRSTVGDRIEDSRRIWSTPD
ncbi:unnamed protein product [Chrysoparadoxa australica]